MDHFLFSLTAGGESVTKIDCFLKMLFGKVQSGRKRNIVALCKYLMFSSAFFCFIFFQPQN